MKELPNLAWYNVPQMGWRIMHVSGRFPDRWSVTKLGAGLLADVRPSLLSAVDSSTVQHFHSEERGGKRFECYVITPPADLRSAPFHWYVDLDAQYAGGDAATEAEAKQNALALIDEKGGPRES